MWVVLKADYQSEETVLHRVVGTQLPVPNEASRALPHRLLAGVRESTLFTAHYIVFTVYDSYGGCNIILKAYKTQYWEIKRLVPPVMSVTAAASSFDVVCDVGLLLIS